MPESKITPRVEIDYEGITYSAQIATIKSTNLGYEDHGIMTAFLMTQWDGGGIGVGGYCLDEPTAPRTSDYSRRGSAYGLDYIIRTLEAVGVDRWEKLPGTQVYVLFEGRGGPGSIASGVMGLQTGKAFFPKLHAAAFIIGEKAA